VVSITWTISLTPGVRRRVAPMRVVMASWMDSREYTFLMNPAVQIEHVNNNCRVETISILIISYIYSVEMPNASENKKKFRLK
jgi:hypothetical protein